MTSPFEYIIWMLLWFLRFNRICHKFLLWLDVLFPAQNFDAQYMVNLTSKIDFVAQYASGKTSTSFGMRDQISSSAIIKKNFNHEYFSSHLYNVMPITQTIQTVCETYRTNLNRFQFNRIKGTGYWLN